jgi:hypothetical protein
MRAAAGLFGARMTPFLVRALREGNELHRSAAFPLLGAIAPATAEPLALAALEVADESSEVRSAAAEALGHVHTEAALEALLRARSDRPLVRTAAYAALARHADHGAVTRIVAEVCAGIERGRWDDGLLPIAAAHAFRELAPDLVRRWRSDPDEHGQYEAITLLLRHDRSWARAALDEGLPGHNEGTPSGTGEPHGAVRHLFARAATLILLGDAADAFDALAGYVAPAVTRRCWFERERAEVILLLLLGQLGRNETSWLAGESWELQGRPADPRWIEVCRRLVASPDLAPILHPEGTARNASSRR